MIKLFLSFLMLALVSGCASPMLGLLGDGTAPLEEYTLSGEAREKILVVPVRGTINDEPREGFFQDRPSLLQEVVAQLRKAEKDPSVRALVLTIDSPGGPATASDILYHELIGFKEKTGIPVVASLMDVAASGGYYVALSADAILAHPTTVTGSVGVVFWRPQVKGLMDKLGLDLEVNKSGENKDMGSPFREASAEEIRILQQLTDTLAKRFLDLVAKNRSIDEKRLAGVATARVYLAPEALEMGLVDRIGYLADALERARQLARLPEDAKVVVYRRTEFADDNLYNTALSRGGSGRIGLEVPGSGLLKAPGFYYLWAPGILSDR